MTTYIVQGKERFTANQAEVQDVVLYYEKCILDVGAGDGKGSLRYARAHPDTYVFALDSSFDALTKTSKAALKKPSRGGVENLMCLYGNIRDSYQYLRCMADHIRVILPWGDLLEGIAEVSEDIVGALALCGGKDTKITFVINAEIWKNNLPSRLSHLGEITPDFFLSHNADFAKYGIEITEAHTMTIEEIQELDTTWSAKLMSSRKMANFVMATGVLTGNYPSENHVET
ncbi:MAG TPA: class I SAM-dependent methyltransferase [Acidimicrobiia bacterium]|nr:class I SAM-dependent methyltransferase [Acidimicrobiia bacterium]